MNSPKTVRQGRQPWRPPVCVRIDITRITNAQVAVTPDGSGQS